MQTPPNPAIFDAFSTRMVQSDDGRTIIERLPIIRGGQLVPIFPPPPPTYTGIGHMQLPGPGGQPVAHEFAFDIEGAGDLVEAFALFIAQVNAAGKREYDRINDALRRQALSGGR